MYLYLTINDILHIDINLRQYATYILTNEYEQYVHTKDTNTVANMPVISPEHWKANGMARMPVPRDALSK